MAMVDAALDYARRGEPIFPLRENGKEPATYNGFYDASINDAEIEKLFVKPTVNIGLRVGQESNIIVIDSDNKGDSPAARSVRYPFKSSRVNRSLRLDIPV